MVDIKYKRALERYITLEELKKTHLEHKAKGGPLADLALFTRARLSVCPIREKEWNHILKMEKEKK